MDKVCIEKNTRKISFNSQVDLIFSLALCVCIVLDFIDGNEPQCESTNFDHLNP